jgi:protein ImuB
MFGAVHAVRAPASADALLLLAREFTPRVEACGPATVLLDLHGLARAWPQPDALGRALVDAARGRGLGDPHVALAFSRVAARLLAAGREGVTVATAGQEAQLLAPLPLELLGLPGERADLFRRWGLRTLGDLARLPAEGLADRLGPEGPRLWRLARGEDDAPLVPAPPPERFECALELDWPVEGLEPLAFLLARVLEPLGHTLAARGRRAAALTLELRLVDTSVHRRTLKPAAPTGLPRTWRTLLLLDLESHPPRDAIQAITVRAVPTPAREVQFSLLDPALPSPERLAETLGRLQEWTEAGRGGAAALVDTHRPGAFVVETFSPGAFEPSSVGPAAAVRLALRAFRPPRPARVTVEAGAPVFVAAAGVRGAVVDRAGPWRASGDWWDVAWSREEWDVAIVAAGLYRVFRDRLRDEWFVEGELD